MELRKTSDSLFKARIRARKVRCIKLLNLLEPRVILVAGFVEASYLTRPMEPPPPVIHIPQFSITFFASLDSATSRVQLPNFGMKVKYHSSTVQDSGKPRKVRNM